MNYPPIEREFERIADNRANHLDHAALIETAYERRSIGIERDRVLLIGGLIFLNNLIDDPRIALLFLIPGVGETLRVNGRAEICVDPDLLARFPAQGKLPRSVIVVHVERVYFQCPKALVRSDLWNPAKHVERRSLPSSGTILADITRGRVGGAEYDAAYPERLKATIY